MSASWLIVGCGYTGERLARRLLASGAEVWLTSRAPEAAAARCVALGEGARPLHVRLPDALGAVAAVPPGAVVAILAPPVDERGTGEAALVAALPSAARVIYVSSTGVYGPGHGEVVDEDAPLAPATATGRARVAAEAAVRAGPAPWTVLRPAGIYGPGRGLAERARAGTLRVVGDGRAHVCRIHVDDLVTVIMAAAAPRAAGRIYNVADDAPTPLGVVADGVAAALGLPAPGRVAIGSVTPEVRAMLTADRRISNQRMRVELGVSLAYPTWRDGLADELAN